MTGIRPRADTVVVLATPWWRCAGRALLRGCRMPHTLPEGCESFWDRSIDGLSAEGRTRMIEELNDAAEFLRSVDHELTDVSVAGLLQQGP
jgi:hypothetical protein